MRARAQEMSWRQGWLSFTTGKDRGQEQGENQRALELLKMTGHVPFADHHVHAMRPRCSLRLRLPVPNSSACLGLGGTGQSGFSLSWNLSDFTSCLCV